VADAVVVRQDVADRLAAAAGRVEGERFLTPVAMEE
jgi:hypothetical protein